MTHAQKKEFVKSVKHFAATDLHWLIRSHNTPNGHETAWTRKVVAAAIARFN